MAKLITHYDNLKVVRNAPPEVIRAAYKVLCQKYHPDRNDDPDATRIMKIINEAYEVLSDPHKRAEHDLWIKSQEQENNNSSYDQQKSREQAYRESQAREQAQREEEAKAKARQEAQAQERSNQEAWVKEQARWAEAKEQAWQQAQQEAEFKQSKKKKNIILLVLIGGILSYLIFIFVDMSSNQKNAQVVGGTPNVPIVSGGSKELLLDESSVTDEPVNNTEADLEETYPTSFDCRKARSITENLICHHVDLAKADLELANLVKIARASISDQKALNNRLKKQWNYREKNCKDVACLITWFAYQKDILTQIAATGDVTVGLAKVELKPESLPSTGDKEGGDFEGVAPLKIRVPYDGDHYFVKIEDANTKKNIVNYFIRAGETLHVDLPIGAYRIKYAYGKHWYGVDNLFGEDTKYATANQIFNFNFDGDQYNGFTIELIKQVNGNLKTSSINKSQF